MPDLTIPQELHVGRVLLELPQLNKGTAFTRLERAEKSLIGLLPLAYEGMDEHLARAYQAYQQKHSALEKHIYLRQLQNVNETLFFSLIIEHAAEMLPVIYTPTVGEACQQFSDIFRKPQGLFLNYPERRCIDQSLDNVTSKNIEVIVITDGEAILGIGDQGVGGMGIPIGKLCLYSALGGIHPAATLPIVLDTGTNNLDLLDDDLYIGWRHERVRGQEYDDFLKLVLTKIHRKWPHAVIQFEDFGALNSQRLLHQYADRMCCFNDDIQGTAAVTLGCLMAACRSAGNHLTESKIVIVGAGAAGTGIAAGCVFAMTQLGMDYSSACERVYMLNSAGLIRTESERIRDSQMPFARDRSQLGGWQGGYQLEDVVRNVQPNVLIGVSGQGGMFSQSIVQEMAAHVERPCIFPLSNPTSKTEAVPADLIKWTDGRVIVATGSPFEPVHFNGVVHEIAQCNNAYAFPGIGLGLIAVHASRVTDEMFHAVARVIGNAEPDLDQPGHSLLPPLEKLRALSRDIAIAVAASAVEQGLNQTEVEGSVEQMVDAKIWFPDYCRD